MSRGPIERNSADPFMPERVPFAERGGPLRGVLDVATGCYPKFLFGGSLGDLLPAFHFHDVTREWLEPRLQFLVENGYGTVTCDEIARLVVDGVRPAPRSIALTFDDAWESVWSVALPLLKQYGLRAVLFAIPARIASGPGDTPFVTWPQLREIHTSGVFDVQSHTRSHAMIFGADTLVDFVRPGYEHEPILNRPVRAALATRQVAWERVPLDAGAMHAAAQALVGENDFSAFRTIACQARTPMRCVPG